MPLEKLSLDQISKVAEDVRTIERFQDEALNNGFNSNLFSASIVPGNSPKLFDWPLIAFLLSLFSLFGLVVLQQIFAMQGTAYNLMLLGSLLISTLCVMSAHLKFRQLTVSIIVAVGLIVVLAIGFGILTPKEAIDGAKEIVK
ncbi:hypothetical protein ORJ04_21590 [Rheinheimera baltica]|uniref:Uncharacterized protein n=1 Tax=Rheinheimera baltica TaxID=67576 RepID=A0ABT9I5A4_9GAMM|nr:hypothetical protein [Rheinheimera baltica]MDP5138544.1 hypothetical protein [Rheinheimera baltica]MDP5148854.1 hypothetical protein [Rheinheimera baltica]